MNILLGWTGFVMMNERVMGGCVFSCGIHMGTNMRFRYYTPQLIFGVLVSLHMPRILNCHTRDLVRFIPMVWLSSRTRAEDVSEERARRDASWCLGTRSCHHE